MSRRTGCHAVLAACRVMTLVLAGTAAAGEPPIVAAAASLRHVFPEVVHVWSAAGGVPPEVSYGSSGNLYRQIAQGAPFDLFLSADEEQALKLVRAGRTEGEGAVYAAGRLALLVPLHSGLALDASLADLGRAIGDGRLRRLSIANPAHAPYGRAARDALVRTALWPRLEDRLLLAENAAQGGASSPSPAAPAADSCPTRSRSPGASRPRPATYSSMPPCTARSRSGWCCSRAPAPAPRALYRFLAGPAARRIFERSGFPAPGARPK